MTDRPTRFHIIGVDGSPDVRVAVLYRISEHGACESPIDHKASPLFRLEKRDPIATWGTGSSQKDYRQLQQEAVRKERRVYAERGRT